jgi:hypothetical protein
MLPGMYHKGQTPSKHNLQKRSNHHLFILLTWPRDSSSSPCLSLRPFISKTYSMSLFNFRSDEKQVNTPQNPADSTSATVTPACFQTLRTRCSYDYGESSALCIRTCCGLFRFNNLVCDEVLWIRLFTTIHYIFWKVQTTSTWAPHHRMVSWWSMSHLHSTELQE